MYSPIMIWLYFFNYNIYVSIVQLILSIYSQDIDRYKLANPRTYHYLNQSNCYELDGVDDSKEYLETRRAMDIVGINSDEQVYTL